MNRVINHSHQSNADTLLAQFFIYHRGLNKGQVWKQSESRYFTVLQNKTQRFILQRRETTHMSITTAKDVLDAFVIYHDDMNQT